MAISRNTTVAAIAALSIAVAVAGFRLETTRALAVPPPQGPMGNSAFLGAWCAQGGPTKHCSVSGNGVFLTFTKGIYNCVTKAARARAALLTGAAR